MEVGHSHSLALSVWVRTPWHWIMVTLWGCKLDTLQKIHYFSSSGETDVNDLSSALFCGNHIYWPQRERLIVWWVTDIKSAYMSWLQAPQSEWHVCVQSKSHPQIASVLQLFPLIAVIVRNRIIVIEILSNSNNLSC